MTSPDQKLREREADARSRKVYSSAGMERLREAERGPVSSPASALATRQSAERGTMQSRHHGEGQQLFKEHEAQRAKVLGSSRPLPEIDKQQTRERAQLTEKHGRERAAIEHRHLVERDDLRRKAK